MTSGADERSSHRPIAHGGRGSIVLIPAQPWWSITLILIDLWIIHALFVHRREVL